MENNPAPTTSEPRYEPPRLRSVTTRSGIKGFFTRISIKTKISSRTTAATKNEIVRGSDQPLSAASLNPYVRENRPAVAVITPGMS